MWLLYVSKQEKLWDVSVAEQVLEAPGASHSSSNITDQRVSREEETV